MKENAERKVKTDLVMSAVTEAEAIEATEEELKSKKQKKLLKCTQTEQKLRKWLIYY